MEITFIAVAINPNIKHHLDYIIILGIIGKSKIIIFAGLSFPHHFEQRAKVSSILFLLCPKLL
jgi:hypothetical protein